MPVRPDVEAADRASAFFDRRRGDIGKWVSVVRCGHRVEIQEHQTQCEAYEAVGGSGGSQDPYYYPPAGDPGSLTTKAAGTWT